MANDTQNQTPTSVSSNVGLGAGALGAGINVVGGLLGSVLNNHYAKQADKRNMENWRMQQMYNSPVLQSARMRVAGIAPYHVAGQIASGAAADSVPDTNVPEVGSIVQRASESAGQSILSAKRLQIDSDLADSQMELQKEQSDLAQAQAFYQTCMGIGQMWSNKRSEETHGAQVSATLWDSKAIEYKARQEIGNWITQKSTQLPTARAQLALYGARAKEKMALASAVLYDLKLKHIFGEEIGAQQLLALRLSNVGQRLSNRGQFLSNERLSYLNEMLPNEVSLRLGGVARSNFMLGLEIDKFQKEYGEAWYRTYLSGLLSKEQENIWWNSYYSYSNSFIPSGDSPEAGWFGRESPLTRYSPQGAYRLGADSKQQQIRTSQQIGRSAVGNVVVQGLGVAAAYYSPKAYMMNLGGNNGQMMFVQRGSKITPDFNLSLQNPF